MSRNFRSAPLAVLLLLLAAVAGCAPSLRSDRIRTLVQTDFWGLDKIKVLDAWSHVPDTSLGVIAVVDSGLAANPAHADLPAPQLLPGHNQCAALGKPDQDEDGHGTKVSGILAAKIDPPHAMGVAPGAQLRPYKVLCPSGFVESRAVDGVNAAVSAAQPPDVLNGSWADLPRDAAVARNLEEAIGKHPAILFVFAAPPGTGPYPAYASYGNVLVVTASDKDDSLPRWAGHDAAAVHLAAPGVAINTTDLPTSLDPHNGTTFQGSSAAAAFVSGCGVLVKLAAKAANPSVTLSGAQIREYLLSGAEEIKGLKTSVKDGLRLNCGRAVTKAIGR